MKNRLIRHIPLLLLMAALACKKDNTAPTATSALTIVNSVVGSAGLVTNFDSRTTLKYYSTAQQIGYGSFQEFGSYTGNVPLALSDISDTTHTVYDNPLNLPLHSISTLFLTGTLASPESFLTTDNLPYHLAADSSLSVRFANISPGSNPMSVNIQGSADGSEVASLAYKSVTAFKNYSAKGNINSYTFEFHDATTGNLIASYTMNGINDGVVNTNQNRFRWKNFTIALYDIPGNQHVLLINNY
ncbi:hypothetical protein [Mucilaginibacter ginsenosidivorans]|uniref:DUF4397 domain-containing protein n=1 Tax=Mucilaginibacter ginsenosidivorans TaxID=398053 RepID=A0A5B8UU72_9SPHI|nr:hypothetical protein [Mucilaginibacter ginsenosidivorans]QEC62438.1 hypothetical protein FRZ54_07505 [Mucilaginibacter ginsenosidivorans]